MWLRSVHMTCMLYHNTHGIWTLTVIKHPQHMNNYGDTTHTAYEHLWWYNTHTVYEHLWWYNTHTAYEHLWWYNTHSIWTFMVIQNTQHMNIYGDTAHTHSIWTFMVMQHAHTAYEHFWWYNTHTHTAYERVTLVNLAQIILSAFYTLTYIMNPIFKTSSMALQSSVDLHLFVVLPPVSSVFWPLFPICSFAFINICLYTVPSVFWSSS